MSFSWPPFSWIVATPFVNVTPLKVPLMLVSPSVIWKLKVLLLPPSAIFLIFRLPVPLYVLVIVLEGAYVGSPAVTTPSASGTAIVAVTGLPVVSQFETSFSAMVY